MPETGNDRGSTKWHTTKDRTGGRDKDKNANRPGNDLDLGHSPSGSILAVGQEVPPAKARAVKCTGTYVIICMSTLYSASRMQFLVVLSVTVGSMFPLV